MKVLRILRFAAFAVGILALLSFFVLRLWNWLMPEIFSLHAINYGQALGLLVLSKILFGGFRGGRGPGGFFRRRRMMQRWAEMTPEEREKFRTGLRAGCGPFGGSPATPAKE
jgi:hypothetical protein